MVEVGQGECGIAVGGEQGRVRRHANTAPRPADGQHRDPRWAARRWEGQHPRDLVGAGAQRPDGDAVAEPLAGEAARGELAVADGHGEVDGERRPLGRVKGSLVRVAVDCLVGIAVRRVHRPEQAHAVHALVGA